jgi:pSer/pThr/pTyr-binding forkhead associated (FHA) protein
VTALVTGPLGKVVLLGALYLVVAVVVWMEARELAHATARRPTVVGAQRGSRSPATLVLLEGVGPSQVPLRGTELMIGRDQRCQVHIPEGSVSNHHARVYQSDGEWYVEDLGSKNLTYLNERPVTRSMLLRVGDKIAIGRSVIEVRS